MEKARFNPQHEGGGKKNRVSQWEKRLSERRGGLALTLAMWPFKVCYELTVSRDIVSKWGVWWQALKLQNKDGASSWKVNLTEDALRRQC